MRKKYSVGIPSNVSPEQYLFQRVLFLQVTDALGHTYVSSPGQRNDLIRTARKWLCFGEDMVLVSTFAGFDPDTVRLWAIKQRDRGWPDAIAHPQLDVA